MTWEEKYVKVVSKGGHEYFFQRFALAVEVTSLLIVSPWIMTLEGERRTLKDVLSLIEEHDIPTTIVMRNPEKEPWNRDAAKLLVGHRLITLYYNNDLHAKIYVCKCQPYGFALLSSANLSGKATRAPEVGLMIEGRGEGRNVIDELEAVGKTHIPNRAGTERRQTGHRRLVD